MREASDGHSGLQELQRRKPDLLMADYLMPGMNGAERAAAARRLYPQMPVLVATGYAEWRRSEGGGFTLVLRKPFDLETLGGAASAELGRARITLQAAGGWICCAASDEFLRHADRARRLPPGAGKTQVARQ